jgi:MoxR-like ATPase
MKFNADEPFFIMGEAGWGKTSIIKSMAKRFGRRVITIYLDKCEATDLGGIPVPREDKRGNAYVDSAMPAWAQYMLEHEDDQFLLFFDEMNQADGAVMNALMPIVLETEVCGVKFDNFIVGAAGNFDHENDAVNELSGPLKSRFKPIIVWETGGDSEWKQAFDFMHKGWDNKLGEEGSEFINILYENRDLFQNPREVEHKILKWCSKMIAAGNKELFKVEDYLDRLEGLAKEDLNRTQEDKLKKLAEVMYNLVNGLPIVPSKSRGKGKEMIDEKLKKTIIKAMKSGFITNGPDSSDKRKYGISRENAPLIFCDPEMTEDPINREMFDRFVNKAEADGVTFKYETDDEWRKAGLSDPFED